jgi:hypothetical protein
MFNLQIKFNAEFRWIKNDEQRIPSNIEILDYSLTFGLELTMNQYAKTYSL